MQLNLIPLYHFNLLSVWKVQHWRRAPWAVWAAWAVSAAWAVWGVWALWAVLAVCAVWAVCRTVSCCVWMPLSPVWRAKA